MLTKYNRRTIAASSGAVVAGATVRFYNQLTGTPAAVYSDPDGDVSLGTSIISGLNGEVEVFMYPGVYHIEVEADGDLIEEIDYEPIVSEFALTELTDAAINLLSIGPAAADSFLRFNAGGAVQYRTPAEVRTDLSLGTMALQNAISVSITGGTVTGITDLAIADGGTGASTAADARTNLGLGTMATQAASAVAITGGSITAITDLSIADGGTGASTAANARTNLGLGSLAIKSTINNDDWTGTDLALANGGTGASDAATARTNLGLGSIATQAASGVAITGGSITGITDLALADGGTGASDASGARTNLGLGTIATQNAAAVTISGGSVTGIVDIAVTDGGTGASDAATARVNLGIGIAPPTTASSVGSPGQTAYDTDYFYICTATDTWRRIAHVTW